MDSRGGPIPTVQDYQHRAAECLRLSHGTRNPTNKAFFLEMALTWVKLADQAQAKEREARPALDNPVESWAAVAQGGPA